MSTAALAFADPIEVTTPALSSTVRLTLVLARGWSADRPVPRSLFPNATPPGLTLEMVTLLEASDGWVVLLHFAEKITATQVIFQRGRRGHIEALLLESHTQLTLQNHATAQGAIVARLRDVWAACVARTDAGTA